MWEFVMLLSRVLLMLAGLVVATVASQAAVTFVVNLTFGRDVEKS